MARWPLLRAPRAPAPVGRSIWWVGTHRMHHGRVRSRVRAWVAGWAGFARPPDASPGCPSDGRPSPPRRGVPGVASAWPAARPAWRFAPVRRGWWAISSMTGPGAMAAPRARRLIDLVGHRPPDASRPREGVRRNRELFTTTHHTPVGEATDAARPRKRVRFARRGWWPISSMTGPGAMAARFRSMAADARRSTPSVGGERQASRGRLHRRAHAAGHVRPAAARWRTVGGARRRASGTP
jgi:hypothetical protein